MRETGRIRGIRGTRERNVVRAGSTDISDYQIKILQNPPLLDYGLLTLDN
jgi:hypothetical protein